MSKSVFSSYEEDDEEATDASSKKDKSNNPFNWNLNDANFNIFGQDNALFDGSTFEKQLYNDFMTNSCKNYYKSNDDFETNLSKKSFSNIYISNPPTSNSTNKVATNTSNNIFNKEVGNNLTNNNLVLNNKDSYKQSHLKVIKETISSGNNSSQISTNENSRKDKLMNADIEKKEQSNFKEPLSKNLFEKENIYSLTINNIINIKSYYLGQFKCLKSKETILKYAVGSFNSTVIITIANFLRSTLSEDNFIKLLKKFPLACSEYIYFLKETEGFTNIPFILRLSQSKEEEMSICLENCLYNNDNSLEKAEKQLNSIMNKNKLILCEHANLINDQLSLIKYQLDIETSENNLEENNSVSLWSIIELARKYISKFIIDSISINESLKRKFKLDQYTIDFLTIEFLCKNQKWKEVENCFYSKSSFGIQKTKSSIPLEYLIYYLHSQNAPTYLLKLFTNLLDDEKLKLKIAESLKLYDIVVDLLFNSKEMLNDFMNKLNLNDRTVFQIALSSKKLKQ